MSNWSDVFFWLGKVMLFGVAPFVSSKWQQTGGEKRPSNGLTEGTVTFSRKLAGLMRCLISRFGTNPTEAASPGEMTSIHLYGLWMLMAILINIRDGRVY